MTGTGTSSDPYVIHAEDTLKQKWSDFITAIGTKGAYVQCPSEVWDMNEIYPSGWNTQSRIRAFRVYGNGLIIRNLYSTCSTTYGLFRIDSSTGYIYDLTFQNLYYSGSSPCFGGSSNNSTTTFSRCSFSGIIDSNVLFAAGNKLIFNTKDGKGCSFNLKFNNGAKFHGGSYRLTILSGKIVLSGNSNAVPSSSIIMHNCLVNGVLPFSKFIIAGEYNVFDMNVSNGQTISQSSDLVASIINSDKIAEGATIAESLIQVTESQMKNAEYLESIGFPIGVG